MSDAPVPVPVPGAGARRVRTGHAPVTHRLTPHTARPRERTRRREPTVPLAAGQTTALLIAVTGGGIASRTLAVGCQRFLRRLVDVGRSAFGRSGPASSPGVRAASAQAGCRCCPSRGAPWHAGPCRASRHRCQRQAGETTAAECIEVHAGRLRLLDEVAHLTQLPDLARHAAEHRALALLAAPAAGTHATHRAQLTHHLLHLPELLQQIADLFRRDAAAAGD